MKSCTNLILLSVMPLLCGHFGTAAQVESPARLRVADGTNIFQLPDDRGIPWNPGVRGGIPTYTNAVNVKSSPYNAKGDGITDDYAAITNAIAHCPNGGAVLIPRGTYRLSKPIVISFPKQIALRGEGETNTFLRSDSSDTTRRGGINLGYDGSQYTASVLSGSTIGSQTVTVDSTSRFAVGQYALIQQSNDPTVVFGSLSTPDAKWQAQMLKITNISGNSVTFDRPLYYSYSSEFNPELKVYSRVASYCGIESLTLQMTTGIPELVQNGIMIFIAANCWVKNVVVTNGHRANIQLNQCYAAEIRATKTQNHQAYDSNTRYGIQLTQYSTDCLVEDNIVQGNNLSIAIQQGATGNVIAYNFSDIGYGNGYPTDAVTKGGINCHGDNANRNLFEGNVVPWIWWDDFWGESNHQVAFRNWLTRFSYYNPAGLISLGGRPGIYVNATNYFMSVVGNVLGSKRDFGQTTSAWELGLSTRIDIAPDPKSIITLLSHGNFDFSTGVTNWEGSLNRALPSSLFHLAKPAWFGSLPWPSIGPDVNPSSWATNSSVIPAQARWRGEAY